MTSNVTGAGPQLRRRLSLLLALTAAAWLGAGCTQDETLDPAFVDTDSPPIGGVAQACIPGDTRDCYVTLGQQGDVLICYTGTQTCGELGWGECTDGVVSEVPAPTTTALGPTGTRTQAYSADTGCEENPCDPFCRTFVEVPPLPLEADTDPNDWMFTWPVGMASDLPDGLYDKGFQEPCEGGWDCQYNSRCLSPNDGSCSHTLCQTGAALTDDCTSCVTAICEADPTCCGAAVAPPCNTGEVLGPDLTTCYYFELTNATWTTARTNCQARGAGWDLAKVDSSVVQSFVYSYIVADNWIGLNDRTTEGAWQWNDGPVLDFSVDYGNWNGGEPNDYGVGEDCTEMYVSTGRWNDLPCNNYQDYVCAGPRLNASTCTHDPCRQGAALKSGCNVCVAQICGTAGLEYCCNSTTGSWDAACAEAVEDVCGNTCDCRTGEVFWGGSCYFHSGNTKEPGYYAYLNCLARGSGWNLVSIGSQEEQDAIYSLWDTMWIGFTDDESVSSDTNWVWLNGDPAGVWNESTGGSLYTNWDNNEPRNNEDCALMGADGDWDSADCNSNGVKQNWLCEGPGAHMVVMSGGTAVGTGGTWDQDCVDMVFTVCDGQCDAYNPASTIGQCLPWYGGETDPTCDGVDLAVDIPCDLDDGTPVVPVCNHGNTEAPAGIRIVHFAANSQQYPLCSPDQSHPSIEECFTDEPIPPGYCIAVTDCPMPGNNREIMINPAWPGSVEECSCVDNWSLYNAQDCGPPTCSAGMASTTPLYEPVDVIFVIDNSGSMAGEIQVVQDRITSDFADIIEASGLDYRVIMVSRYGHLNTAVGSSNHPICISSPLGADDCLDPASDPLYLNPPNFFHYSADIGSHDAWCKLLQGFTNPDELGDGRWGWTSLAPNGWGTWLREDAFKTFVVITDDNAYCSYGALSFNDGDLGATNVTMGETAAAAFDTALLTLSPEQFGTATERNYIWHSIVGLSEYSTPTEAWPASESIQTGVCSPGSESPGTGYQALSVLTGGLRFPSCRNDDFNAIFQDIALGVLSNAELSCSWEINSTVPIDPSSTTATWVWGTGDEVELTRVRGPEDCAPNAWYYITPTDPRTVTLCPETCDAIHADIGSALIVEIGCAVPAIETVFTERYEAACAIEGAPQWSNLYWNAAIPDDGSRIQFRVRTALTLDELDNATFVDVATAMTSNQVCEGTCYADVFTPLAMPNNRYPFLELEITILPGTEADSPLLDSWELTFSCQPDE